MSELEKKLVEIKDKIQSVNYRHKLVSGYSKWVFIHFIDPLPPEKMSPFQLKMSTDAPETDTDQMKEIREVLAGLTNFTGSRKKNVIFV